jgi:hypothetical protein
MTKQEAKELTLGRLSIRMIAQEHGKTGSAALNFHKRIGGAI